MGKARSIERRIADNKLRGLKRMLKLTRPLLNLSAQSNDYYGLEATVGRALRRAYLIAASITQLGEQARNSFAVLALSRILVEDLVSVEYVCSYPDKLKQFWDFQAVQELRDLQVRKAFGDEPDALEEATLRQVVESSGFMRRPGELSTTWARQALESLIKAVDWSGYISDQRAALEHGYLEGSRKIHFNPADNALVGAPGTLPIVDLECGLHSATICYPFLARRYASLLQAKGMRRFTEMEEAIDRVMVDVYKGDARLRKGLKKRKKGTKGS